MLRAERVLPEGEGTEEEGFGVLGAVLRLAEVGQTENRVGNLRMVGAQGLLCPFGKRA